MVWKVTELWWFYLNTKLLNNLGRRGMGLKRDISLFSSPIPAYSRCPNLLSSLPVKSHVWAGDILTSKMDLVTFIVWKMIPVLCLFNFSVVTPLPGCLSVEFFLMGLVDVSVSHVWNAASGGGKYIPNSRTLHQSHSKITREGVVFKWRRNKIVQE